MTQLALREADDVLEGGRIRLFELSIGRVEDVFTHLSRPRGERGFSPELQVAFPYRGLFVWHVGASEVVGDANQALFVRAREEYRLEQPVPGGYGELIVTPSEALLSELSESARGGLATHFAFRARSRRLDPGLQALRAGFLEWARTGDAPDTLEAEERVLALLRASLEDAPRPDSARSTQRLLRRTKEYLEAELHRPIKLAEIAAVVGASPTYLTHLFRTVEGVPLHRYLTQLRLARALHALPHTDDLTGLALELGFCSHSHFTAAFRGAFGTTPSRHRQLRGRAAS